jgi:hypothetical protein
MRKREVDLAPAAIVAFENSITRESLVRAVQAGRVRGRRDERGWLVSRGSAAEFAKWRQPPKPRVSQRTEAPTTPASDSQLATGSLL